MSEFTFTTTPPLKTEKIKVEEWDPDEEFTISEVRALEFQEMVREAFGGEVGGNIQLYSCVLSKCMTNSKGEKPSKEWLMGLPASMIPGLKRAGDIALSLNGLPHNAQEQIRKNSE